MLEVTCTPNKVSNSGISSAARRLVQDIKIRSKSKPEKTSKTALLMESGVIIPARLSSISENVADLTISILFLLKYSLIGWLTASTYGVSKPILVALSVFKAARHAVIGVVIATSG